MQNIKAFISYSHKDKIYFESLREGIQEHTNILKIEWEIWDDEKLMVGQTWHNSIQKAVKSCQLAILFISPSFFNSKYIIEEELNNFLIKAEADSSFLLFPILIRPCSFQRFETLAKFQYFLPNGDDYGFPEITNLAYSFLVDDFSKKSYLDLYHMNLSHALDKSILSVINTKDLPINSNVYNLNDIYNQSKILIKDKQLFNKILHSDEANRNIIKLFERVICPLYNDWQKNLINTEYIIATSLYLDLLLRKSNNPKYRNFNDLNIAAQTQLNNLYEYSSLQYIDTVKKIFDVVLLDWESSPYDLENIEHFEGQSGVMAVIIIGVATLVLSVKKFAFDILPIDSQSDLFDHTLENRLPTSSKILFNSIIEFETSANNVSEFIFLNLIRFHLEAKIEQISEIFSLKNIDLTLQGIKFKLTDKPENWNVQKFTTDTLKVIHLLMGNELYGSQSHDVWFREVFQNAIDACSSRELIESNFTQKKEIVITHDTTLRKVTIKDNGIGMSTNHVNRYFSKVGRSFWRSEELIKLSEEGKLKKLSIGKFGIGFLSVFQIADRITIKTRFCQESKGLLIQINSIKEPFFVENLFSADIGTEISIHLKTGYDPDFAEIASKFIAYLPEGINIIGLPFIAKDPYELLKSKLKKINTNKEGEWIFTSTKVENINATLYFTIAFLDEKDKNEANSFTISNNGIIVLERRSQWLGSKKDYNKEPQTGLKNFIGILDFDQGAAPVTASRNSISIDDNNAEYILSTIREQACEIIKEYAMNKFENASSNDNTRITSKIISVLEHTITQADNYYSYQLDWSKYPIFQDTVISILKEYSSFELLDGDNLLVKETAYLKDFSGDNKIIITTLDVSRSPIFKIYYSQHQKYKVIIINSLRTRRLLKRINSNWLLVVDNKNMWEKIVVKEERNMNLCKFIPAEFAFADKEYFTSQDTFITVLPRRRADSYYLNKNRSESDIPPRILINKNHILSTALEEFVSQRSGNELLNLKTLISLLHSLLNETSQKRKETQYSEVIRQLSDLCGLGNIIAKLSL